jgi:hypothetical protein
MEQESIALHLNEDHADNLEEASSHGGLDHYGHQEPYTDVASNSPPIELSLVPETISVASLYHAEEQPPSITIAPENVQVIHDDEKLL